MNRLKDIMKPALVGLLLLPVTVHAKPDATAETSGNEGDPGAATANARKVDKYLLDEHPLKEELLERPEGVRTVTQSKQRLREAYDGDESIRTDPEETIKPDL